MASDYITDEDWDAFRTMRSFDAYWNLKVSYDQALYGLTRNCYLIHLPDRCGRRVICMWHDEKELKLDRLAWETNVRPAAKLEAAAMVRDTYPPAPKVKSVPKKRETKASRLKQTKSRILAVLTSAGSKGMTPTELAGEAGKVSLDAVQKQLQRLKKAGHVEATDGRYVRVERPKGA